VAETSVSRTFSAGSIERTKRAQTAARVKAGDPLAFPVKVQWKATVGRGGALAASAGSGMVIAAPPRLADVRTANRLARTCMKHPWQAC
jgi:hypothetical protein